MTGVERDGAAPVADRMREAALAWLETLDEQQRAAAVGAAPAADPVADAERRRWFYTPTDHGGLTGHAQRPAQQRHAMALVASGLSRAGYNGVATVMGLENVLDGAEGFTATFDRERGRDPGLYYLRVFGDPAGDAPWAWRYGGHHVSVNHLVVDGRVVASTPSFLGANPAASPLPGGLLRPLAGPEDIARELVRSLPADLAGEVLLLPRAPSDIVGGNRSRLAAGDRVIPLAGLMRGPFSDPGRQQAFEAASDALEDAAGLSEADHAAIALTDEPRGVPASALDGGQRALLRALLATYLGRHPEEISPLPRYAEGPDGDAALDALHLAWAGSTVPGEGHYYRLQGPDLLIEFDNFQQNVNHCHGAWRDPAHDFGVPFLT